MEGNVMCNEMTGSLCMISWKRKRKNSYLRYYPSICLVSCLCQRLEMVQSWI